MPTRLQRAVPSIVLTTLVLVGASPLQRGSQESRIVALESQLEGIKTTQDAALGRLDQMRLDLDNTLEPLRVRLADYGEDLRGMEARMVALEEQLILMNERLGDIADGLTNAAESNVARPVVGTPMPPPQPPSGVPGPSVARATGGGDQPAPAPSRSEADSLYSAAYTDYLAANYTLAVSGFEEYLRLFPDSELADNAQYWIGESYFSLQDYRVARTEFLQVSRRHPESETVADALFKAARCLVELGDNGRAASELIELVLQHPLSDTVPIACLQIERLGAVKPTACPA